MHRFTPADEDLIRVTRAGSNSLERLAATHARLRQRRVLGIRLSAVIEILVFAAVMYAIGKFTGSRTLFMSMDPPHPYWIAVLLAACYYGVREALFATAVCTALYMIGPVPTRMAGEGGYAWVFRVMREPILWLLASIVLGEIRDAFRQRMQAMQDRVSLAEERTKDLTLACERLTRQRESLESRVTDTSLTLHAMYQASRAIERDNVGEVLLGVVDLVRTTLAPQKFSLYLLQGDRLEASISEGWLVGDRYERNYSAGTPLFNAMVGLRRTLVVVNPADEPLLRHAGVMAGALTDNDTGAVIGMLKIEAMPFPDLHAANVQNFQLLCQWIGGAITAAQRLEHASAYGGLGSQAAPVGPPTMANAMRTWLADVTRRTHLPNSLLLLELKSDPSAGIAPSALAKHVTEAARLVLRPEPLVCATDAHGGFMVVLHNTAPEMARLPAQRVVTALRVELERAGLHAMVRQRIVPALDVRRAASG